MQDNNMELLWQTSHLAGGNLVYVEQLYDSYLSDPNSVPEEWRSYFDQLPRVDGYSAKDVPHSTVREQFLHISKNKALTASSATPASAVSEHDAKQVKVLQLISAYRIRGHQAASLDPLGLMERENVEDLDLSYHGLSEADLDTEFQTGSLAFGPETLPLRDIVSGLKQTYCSSIGAEYMHIVDTKVRAWFHARLESVQGKPEYERDTRFHLLERLTAAEGLEKYLGSRYPGTKRFGLEGGESLIPLVDELIQRAGGYGAKEIVIGMAHRGRLNVLVNTLGKNPKDLFDEFDGKKLIDSSGDVKYHQGFSSNVMTPGGEAHLALSFNPSHLEIVSPVVEGSVRARQNRREDAVGNSVLPIIMHGDAAFSGQGVVMETFQMSQTRGYKTGGSIHIVINNQVGFTTNKRVDARSTEYCTDVAKMIHAPILHVNGDDPEAVLFATQVALDYRNEFKSDVVIDLVCYRRRGHNEADEPSGTQPLMYDIIKKLPTTRTIYSSKLVELGFITAEQSKKLEDDYRAALDNGEHVTRSLVLEPTSKMHVDWAPYLGHEWTARAKTGVALKTIQKLGKKLQSTPDGLPIQRQVQKIIEDRKKMDQGALPLNWGYGETMAYATLLNEGHDIRITGQDVGRGTFSHRHAVLHNQKDGSAYIPLANLSEDQPRLEIYDSLLSEEAVLAFEYGYSTTNPNALVIWEAQFGDFANGAQVVIDQFITSGEQKWGRLCGLTMLLPHGYEGQGPEHSSARLERYLQLCAQHNIQVCVPTTPAQVFHMLRRQVKRPLRKPLVAITPKSLLRHKEAISTLDDLSNGTFQTVIGEVEDLNPRKVTSVILCSGKVYYDLLDYRRNNEITDTAIVRIEQLYPFPHDDLVSVFNEYPKLKDVVWCQEEPQNQGAWYPTQHRMRGALKEVTEKVYLRYAGREGSASPAAGYTSVHVEEQAALVKQAFDNE
ncbi:2-oxoglutarate dehydrogenase E1 component [Oleiphilus sp. HI0125]|nr:2-oxoglutarate dehydrogenase E1 component [Oleiphilus sp. HI0125]KZZ62966.1 2-oxoglutarate dehydrogenase E1 component [Oleiphilus sp. HI0125]